MMAADTMEALALRAATSGSRSITARSRWGDEAIGLGGEENAARRLIVLRAIDKLDKFDWTEVTKLLGDGRLDESGDFTKGPAFRSRRLTSCGRP